MALYSGGTEMINGGTLLVGGIPTATIVPWSKSAVPSGFLECNGAAVSRSTYSDLFSAIGTTYGAGDGSSIYDSMDITADVSGGNVRLRGTVNNTNTQVVKFVRRIVKV